MIEQALMNLVINARDAMPAGGAIEIRAWNAGTGESGRDGEFVCVSVSDTGAEMSREDIEKIFEPFYTTKEGKGTGLAVVENVVKTHRGWVDVSSEVGRGSTFKVCLPAAQEAPKDKEPGA